MILRGIAVLSLILLLWNPASSIGAGVWREVEVAAGPLGVQLQPQAVRSPEDLGRTFEAIAQAQAEPLAGAAERLDQLGQVAGDHRDVPEVEPRQLAQHDLQDRHRVGVAQGHQRLGEHVRERPEPCPLASGQKNGLHAMGSRGMMTNDE